MGLLTPYGIQLVFSVESVLHIPVQLRKEVMQYTGYKVQLYATKTRDKRKPPVCQSPWNCVALLVYRLAFRHEELQGQDLQDCR